MSPNSDFKSLPVSPEFVDALQELTQKTILECFQVGNTEPEVIELVKNAFNLSYYLTECYRDPKTFAAERKDRFDIEAVVLETVNQIADLGGVFHGPYGSFLRRKGTVLAKVNK